MEESGEPGRVNVSDSVAGHVSSLFALEPRGDVHAKHRGRLGMHFLNGLASGFARDADGWQPNERFAAERNRLLTGYAGQRGCALQGSVIRHQVSDINWRVSDL